MTGTRHTFSSYFTFAIETILKVLWREGVARGPQELVRVTWNRIRRLERRFDALVAQWRAGTLPAPGSVRLHTSPRPSPQSGEGEERTRAASPFPRGRAWIIRQLVPQSGPPCVGTLCLALEEPEMAEFYAAAPQQLGRILRPLSHMIGAPLPEWLKLPRRKRVRKKKDTSPRPSPQSGEGEKLPPHPAAARFPDTPAARSAARALARVQAGLPVDVTKLSSVAYGYFLHPPRDGNCPPPEIGYARSRRRWPKDHDPKNWDSG